MPVRAYRIYRYMGFQCLFRGERGTALQMHTQSVLRVTNSYITRHPALRAGEGLWRSSGRDKPEDENDGITTKVYLWKEQLAIHPHFSARGKRKTCLLFLPS